MMVGSRSMCAKSPAISHWGSESDLRGEREVNGFSKAEGRESDLKRRGGGGRVFWGRRREEGLMGFYEEEASRAAG